MAGPNHPSTVNQLGTLGTGNHFIEVCVESDPRDASEDPRIWVMLHSGSRGIGNKIGTVFTRRAQAEMKREGVNLPDLELGFLRVGTRLAEDYLAFANWRSATPGKRVADVPPRAGGHRRLDWGLR